MRLSVVRVLLLVLALVLAAAYFELSTTSELPAIPAWGRVLFLSTGLVYVATGLVWWRSRGSLVRTGLLLAAAGDVWLLYGLKRSTSDLVYSVAVSLQGLWLPVVVHVVLAYPSGRLRSPLDRRVVAWATPSPRFLRSARVVLADDSVLFREGLARLLHDENFDVVASVGDADRLVVETLRQRPDVAIVDVRMPPAHTKRVSMPPSGSGRRHPKTGVLILSQFVEAHHALSLLASSTAGVGYLLKDRVVDVTSFVESVRRVASGGTVFDPEVVDQLLHPRVTATPLDALTSRERDVLALMAQGASNTANASHLCISGKTVETHIRSIFTHLNLNPETDQHRRVTAVLTYLHHLP
jgi:DNA-binding NarL/FixJ family response regulator